MAYTDDAVLAKMSALNESHESIATTAQWIMFHRRHAAQTVHLWLTKLKDLPSPKRLNLIYLANEVTQQSKARAKNDFLQAFSPFIAEAAALAYKGASTDIQNKIKRVVEVWRDRQIFDVDVQLAIEAGLHEIDKSRHATKTGGFGGFGSASSPVPPELAPVVPLLQTISKGNQPTAKARNTAMWEYSKAMDPAQVPAAAPVYAARLNGLLKVLASAEVAVSESIKTRRELVAALEKLLTNHQEALRDHEQQLADLHNRQKMIERKKHDVEMSIVGGNADDIPELPKREHSPEDRLQRALSVPEPDPPKVEALTPPSDHGNDDSMYDNMPDYSNATAPQNDQPQSTEPTPASAPVPAPGIVPVMAGQPQPAQPSTTPVVPQQSAFPSAPGIEMLSAIASQYQAVPVNGALGSNKKRKIGPSDEFPDLGGDDGIDADVAEMLAKDKPAP